MTIPFPRTASIRPLAMAACLTLMAAGCAPLENTFLPSQFQSNRPTQTAAQLSPSEKNDFKNAWMGKRMDDVEKQFGRPSQMETLEDTGGKRYYYREPGQPHYVFEFTPNGKVSAAAIVD
jgi:hypothetical protein